MQTSFNHNTEERFADIQMLRYQLPGFETLTLQQKQYIYYLAQATLWGRDITCAQFGRLNLHIRKLLETVYEYYDGDRTCNEFKNLVVYLKRVWFSNGIHHHYGSEKFIPEFSSEYLSKCIEHIGKKAFYFGENTDTDATIETIKDLIFNPETDKKLTSKDANSDMVKSSAVNYYDNISQVEVEEFYKQKDRSFLLQNPSAPGTPSWGLNTRLVKDKTNNIQEQIYRVGELFGETIERIVYWLEKAKDVAENEQQKMVLSLLIDYYQTGNLQTFDKYSIEWLKEKDGLVDFINGFIEVYADPLGYKGSWEGIVEYKDVEATRRTSLICGNAQWFEDNSPIAAEYKKDKVKGVTANVINAAMLGGDEYPSSAIGINLPNADWIREAYGSKSVTIGNLTKAYNEAAKQSGMLDEFVFPDDELKSLIKQYGNICDDLHTDLHECLGHGSGKMKSGIELGNLKNYGSTIEEARADLFGLYYIADQKLVELGLVPDENCYKSQYYTYMMNGLLTQLTRIELGKDIEEDHMRNRALIARWCLEKGRGQSSKCGVDVIEIKSMDNKAYILINDYEKLRELIATLLKEIQRIKSEGDFEAAKEIVENYGVKIDQKIHSQILERYNKLNLAPYKGFINPLMIPVLDQNGCIKDIVLDYEEQYDEQMLRYSNEYSLFGR